MPRQAPPPYLLVLTATVIPHVTTNLLVTDPAQRLGQYLDALRGWLRAPDAELRSIAFIENSGADLSPFRALVDAENQHRRDVELIGLSAADFQFPAELGKGYGEFLAIEQGLACSRLAEDHRYYAKVTGRLRVKNFGAIVRRLPHDYDLAADVLPPDKLRGGFVDSRLIFWSREFHRRHIVGLYRQMNDSNNRIAEHVLYDLVCATTGGRFVTSLPREPRFAGTSGTHGFSYDSWRETRKLPWRSARRAVRRLIGWPNLEKLRAQWRAKAPVAAATTAVSESS